MLEMIEFRVPIENAIAHLPAGIGVTIGSIRKVELAIDDPLVERIGSLQSKYNAEDRAFFFGWTIHRRYTRRELQEARLLHVWPRRAFEPAGEECGTLYDDTEACNHVFVRTAETEVGGHKVRASSDICGAGARQLTSLLLDGRRIPRNVDFARTISGELVVSARVVQLFREHGLTGVEFDTIRLSDRGGEPSQEFYQLSVIGRTVELDSATRAGSDPFDESSYGRCPRGHVLGLNLLSEVMVKTETVSSADVMVTRPLTGVRRGLLRPRPLMLLSPRCWRAIDDAGMRGLIVEVAHLVKVGTTTISPTGCRDATG